jgi:biotin carboxyl carrier protein
VIFEHGGDTYSVTLQRQPDGSYTALVGKGNLAGRPYTLHATPLQNGGWLLTLDGQRHVAYVAAQGDARYVHSGGHTFTLTVPDKRPTRRKASGSSGDLTAQMPGQVLDVPVAAGDTVERGQTLMILEAMKMEIRVTAPDGGVVKRLLVA